MLRPIAPRAMYSANCVFVMCQHAGFPSIQPQTEIRTPGDSATWWSWWLLSWPWSDAYDRVDCRGTVLVVVDNAVMAGRALRAMHAARCLTASILTWDSNGDVN